MTLIEKKFSGKPIKAFQFGILIGTLAGTIILSIFIILSILLFKLNLKAILGESFLASLASIFFWELMKLIIKTIKNQKFKEYEGNYTCYKKYDEKRVNPIYNLSISVKNNKLIIKGEIILNKSKIQGAIIMKEDLPNYGEGYYRHLDIEGWGFYQIQIKSLNEIFVHAPYFNENGEVDQAFVWIKK